MNLLIKGLLIDEVKGPVIFDLINWKTILGGKRKSEIYPNARI
jgi:hypothetical protein